MKKILIIVSIVIVLSFGFYTAINWYFEVTSPEKILRVGEQVDEDKINFIKEIEDGEKIMEYENLIRELVFSKKELEIDRHPDRSIHIMHKKGYITDVAHIWIEKNDGIIVKPNDGIILDSNNSKVYMAKITEQQLEKLREITE